jgi:hypothetical protein
MKALVQCFLESLLAEPSDLKAWEIGKALAILTLKRLDSTDPKQCQLEALDIAFACDPDGKWDHDSAKAYVSRAKLLKFFDSRHSTTEEYFRHRGYKSAIRIKNNSTTGRHKATWQLAVCELNDGEPRVSPISDSTEDDAYSRSEKQDGINYSISRPPSIKLNLLGKLMLGRGEFMTRSGRGAFWASLMFFSILPLLSFGWLLIALGTLKHDIRTDEFVLVLTLIFVCVAYWHIIVRPWVLLLDDRIMLGGNFLTGFMEESVQLDMAKDEKHRYIRLVRYTATCTVCAGNVELRYGTGENKRRIFGCCSEVPQEHVFTFDRVTKVGQRYQR